MIATAGIVVGAIVTAITAYELSKTPWILGCLGNKRFYEQSPYLKKHDYMWSSRAWLWCHFTLTTAFLVIAILVLFEVVENSIALRWTSFGINLVNFGGFVYPARHHVGSFNSPQKSYMINMFFVITIPVVSILNAVFDESAVPFYALVALFMVAPFAEVLSIITFHMEKSKLGHSPPPPYRPRKVVASEEWTEKHAILDKGFVDCW